MTTNYPKGTPVNISLHSEQIGEVTVDSGLLMIGDPCYSIPGPSWDVFCDAVGAGDPDSGPCEPLGPGLGIVATTTYGDGTYPVYGLYDMPGRLVGIAVLFGVDGDDE